MVTARNLTQHQTGMHVARHEPGEAEEMKKGQGMAENEDVGGGEKGKKSGVRGGWEEDGLSHKIFCFLTFVMHVL